MEDDPAVALYCKEIKPLLLLLYYVPSCGINILLLIDTWVTERLLGCKLITLCPVSHSSLKWSLYPDNTVKQTSYSTFKYTSKALLTSGSCLSRRQGRHKWYRILLGLHGKNIHQCILQVPLLLFVGAWQHSNFGWCVRPQHCNKHSKAASIRTYSV